MHDFALKLLLKLATDKVTFKPHVDALTEWEKQQLQSSIQNIAQTERTVARTTVKISQPLSLDLSKFK